MSSSTKNQPPAITNGLDDEMRIVMDASPVGILAFDAQECVLYANPQAERMFGKPFPGPGRMRCGDFISCPNRRRHAKGCGHSPDCPHCPILRDMRATLSSKTSDSLQGDTQLARASDSGPVWIHYRFQGLIRHSNRVAIAALYDITSRKVTEEREAQIRRILLAIRNVNQLIVQEADSRRLIDGVCRSLTETLGYYSAWIALRDTAKERFTATASAGFDGGFHPMDQALLRGEYPKCVRDVLASGSGITIHHPSSKCLDCPLKHRYQERSAMARPLSHQGHIFGILTVSIPHAYADDSEHRDLFTEVANDVGFALHRLRDAEDLRESERRFRNIFDHATDSIFISDVHGTIREVNAVACRRLGFTRSELLGMTIADIECPDDPDFQRERLTLIADQGQIILEAVHRRKDGREIPVEINSRKIQYDKQSCILSVARDITDRRLAERALLENERQKDLILNSTHELVAYYDIDFNLIWANRIFKEAMGQATDSLIGKNYADIWHCPNPGDASCSLADVRDTGIPKQIEKGTPDDRLWSVRAYPVFDETRRIIAVVEFGQEITERKRLESQLRQAQKMEAIGTLAGGIAHDFNNILGAIVGHAEIACEQLADDDPISESLNHILLGAHRAKELVRQILAFSRKGDPEKMPVKIRPLVEEALRFLRASLPSTIEIRKSLKARQDVVIMDPTQFQQILMNLCTNAAHAMGGQAGVLKLGLENVTVEPVAEAVEPCATSQLKLTVEDTGCGIPEDELERIFEPYFTTKQKGVGTGLGLAVAHGIVADCGGRINVHSVVGEGSTFEVFLPVVTFDKPFEINPSECLPTGDERILVVEDEATLLNLTQLMLRRLGYRVVGCSDSLDALKRFQADPRGFDLVITDMTMPHLTGDRLAAELLKLRPDLPIILWTGYTELITDEAARSIGIREFVHKPLLHRDLAVTVRKAIDHR